VLKEKSVLERHICLLGHPQCSSREERMERTGRKTEVSEKG